jgi:p-hydroxybenzoate 3-monooxygenase
VNVQRTQVAIIGAGPAGLLLGQLLSRNGIDSVVLETTSRAHVESRVRAGVLEHQSVDILDSAGVGERMRREGLLHHGIELRFEGDRHRIDFEALTGKSVMIYGQHEVVKDLIAARVQAGLALMFEATDVQLSNFEGRAPRVQFQAEGQTHELECDFIAGCDGFHGISRSYLPASEMKLFERVYPFAWLGILAGAPPASQELIYALHDHGFALLSMRSPTLSRLYLQCAPDENLDEWPDQRVWDELQLRLETRDGFSLSTGPIQQKSVTAMRSFVVEPMQSGRLFLAGDAAHIVPPTGAKGMNLAIADVHVLARALTSYFRDGSEEPLKRYSEDCLQRIWKVQRFSWWMTALLHRFDTDNAFDRRRQLAELEYISASRAAQQTLAENYVGLPLE